MNTRDTIVAIASGAGRAGIGVIRISGAKVPEISQHFFNEALADRQAVYRPFLAADGSLLDKGIAIRFEAPHSYTGEHVLELQGHGGPVVLDLLVKRMVSFGARLANPGEFSERAFLNEKIDLAQAEAVSDLINSSTVDAARAAARSLHGDFSNHVQAIQDELTRLRVWLEAALDFSEEEIDFLADNELQLRAQHLVTDFDQLLKRTEQGQKLRDGVRVVLAGVANAGKSSLLNCLVGSEAAIVTPVEGTTRDVVKEQIHIQGVPLHIMDTAGIRVTQDVVEQEGIRRTIESMHDADHVVVLIDASMPELPELPDNLSTACTRVINKSDRVEPEQIAHLQDFYQAELAISAKQGSGIEQFKEHLLKLTGVDNTVEGVYSARRRHLEALNEARRSTYAALTRLQESNMPELAAEELRYAQLSLDSVLGRFDNEDLLGKIFSDFCIGK